MKKKEELNNLFLCLFGSFMYCIGFTYFVKSAGLYAGGFVGISQLLSLLTKGTPLAQYDIQGTIYFLINIPLFIIGMKKLGKRFILKSFSIVLFESIVLSILPPIGTLVEDTLTAVILGGSIEGIGSAIMFRGFGSGGGTDILGMFITRKVRNFSVGKVAFIINLGVYAASGILFSPETAIYSFIASIFCSIMIDKMHLQNNTVSVNIFTEKNQEVKDLIIRTINRDVTVLSSIGGYSGKERQMLVSIMSEYELKIFERRLKEIDENAFIFVHPNITVLGNYEKRLSR